MIALALLAAVWLAGSLWLVGRNYPIDAPINLQTLSMLALVCWLVALALTTTAVLLAV